MDPIKLRAARQAIAEADAVLIGAGAGLSTSAGLTYTGRRFAQYFADFIACYHFPDMYVGGFYAFPTPQEYWAYWSRYIFINRCLLYTSLFPFPSGNTIGAYLPLAAPRLVRAVPMHPR